jgi:hypothetical protein
MKRFLSWLVLMLCNGVVGYVITLIAMLASYLVAVILDMGIGAVIIVLLLCGGVGTGLAIILPALCAYGSTWLSQKVCKSMNGKRYSVIGTIMIILYGINFLAALIGVFFGDYAIYQVVAFALMVYYSIMIIVVGHERADTDGAPLTKREKLEMRLAKEKERESKAAAIEAFKEMEKKGIDVKTVIAEAQSRDAQEM